MTSLPAAAARTDERRLRFERALLAVLLLAGFVWHQDLVIVVVLAVEIVGLVPGVGVRPLAVPWDALVAPRLRPPRRTVTARHVRDGDIVLVAGLGVAALFVLIGVGLIGRTVALVVAVVAALEAGGAASLLAWPMRRARRGR